MGLNKKKTLARHFTLWDAVLRGSYELLLWSSSPRLGH